MNQIPVIIGAAILAWALIYSVYRYQKELNSYYEDLRKLRKK